MTMTIGFSAPAGHWRDGSGRLTCRHGVILYGTNCIQCERASRLANAVPVVVEGKR